MEGIYQLHLALQVLIDTWWNVNQSFGEEQLKEALF